MANGCGVEYDGAWKCCGVGDDDGANGCGV